MTRVYLPATLPLLSQLRSQPFVLSAQVHAHAVTAALREWYADGDEEELEFVAFTRAAQESLTLLHADPSAPRRRVVLAIDAPPSALAAVNAPAGELGSSAVGLSTPVALADLAAVHVDDPAAEPAIAAAAAAVVAAAGGDDDAAFIVDGAEDHDLLWYDPTEIDTI